MIGTRRQMVIAATLLLLGTVVLSLMVVYFVMPASEKWRLKRWEEYRTERIRYVEPVLRPVVEGLESFRAARGKYPELLQDLMNSGIVARLPSSEDVLGFAHAEKNSIRYGVADDGSTYILYFAYYEPAPWESDYRYVYYVPSTAAWDVKDYIPREFVDSCFSHPCRQEKVKRAREHAQQQPAP